MGLLDGFFNQYRRMGQNTFNRTIQQAASTTKNPVVKQKVAEMTRPRTPSNRSRSSPPPSKQGHTLQPQPRPQSIKAAPMPNQPQKTPFDGLHDFFLPLHEWGKGASKWWDKNAAPAIENAIDFVPYLGPARVPDRRPDGTVYLSPADPLKNGTRTSPNWKGHVGHDALKGVAVDLPKHTTEFATTAPVALAYLGQETHKNPASAATQLGHGFESVVEGTVAAAKENPARFAGEMAGGILVGGKGIRAGATTVKTGARLSGEASGLVRKKTHGVTGAEKIPYMSPAEEVQRIFEAPTISGVRATPNPAGTHIPTRRVRTRNPADIGDIPTGDLDVKGIFMTISRPELEPHGTYFLSKSGGLKGTLAGKRVYLQEDIRTVNVPESLKHEIYDSINVKGDFWGESYNKVLELAQEQSRAYGEPVAVPSPKRAKGIMQPENEAFLVFGSEEATQITQTRWAGFSPQGVPVKRIRYGKQSPIETGRLESAIENLKYNWDVGRSGTTFYNRNYLKAMVHDMDRKTAEIYGDAVSYPGTYAGHGKGHAEGVYSNLVDQWARSPQLQSEVSLPELQLRAKYHDIAKIYDFETQPLPHSFATGEAIRTGLFTPRDILDLSPKQRDLLAFDIKTHTDIMPGFGPRGILTKTAWRPTNTGMALATADRMDLSRFGITPKKSKLFDIPENRLGFQIKSLVGDVATGEQNLPIGFRTKNVPLTEEKFAEITDIFSPKNAPVNQKTGRYEYLSSDIDGLPLFGYPGKKTSPRYSPSKKPIDHYAYPYIEGDSLYGLPGYPLDDPAPYAGEQQPPENSLPYGPGKKPPSQNYLPIETVDPSAYSYFEGDSLYDLPGYPLDDPVPYLGIEYPLEKSPPYTLVDYPPGKFQPLFPSLLAPDDKSAAPTRPEGTKGKKRKKPRKRTRDPYDWITINPVPDIEFIFGDVSPKKGKKRAPPGAGLLGVPATVLAAPKGKKTGKKKSRDPLVALDKDFFEVKI